MTRNGGPLRVNRLLAGVSFGALLLGLSASPATAQLAAMRAAAGTRAPPGAVAGIAATPLRPATMQEALARQQALQTRAQALAGYVTSANKAALAAIKGIPSDGISDGGLNPIQAVRAATLYVAAGTDPATAAAHAAPLQVAAANDPTGLATWEGASAPVQGIATNGKVTVVIKQTQQNALLSWQNFDVGANTALVFRQQQNGVAQPGWTVVNRVVNAVSPSKVLGSITADGTVLILNNAGVLFGPKAQVNLHSLIASSLELGNFASSIAAVGQSQFFVASSIKDRNTAFLQNGLLVQGVSIYKGQLLSALLPTGQYSVTSALPQGVSLPGDVSVYEGAAITAGDGGIIVLAAPTVINAGALSATDGQVSLQAGLNIGAATSTGGTGSADPTVRGLILSSQVPSAPTAPQDHTPDQGVVVNYGLITARRGYISLGTAPFGTVTNAGLLQATTSVSRNGKIALTGGSVTLSGASDPAQASGIVIPADGDGATVPQGTAASPPSFTTSQITIGDAISGYLTADTANDTALFPSLFSMEQNAFILAPSANVVIGQNVAAGTFQQQPAIGSGVSIADGAQINVSGIMAVEQPAAVNSVGISPVKQNELRDTPNYRAVSTDGSFTLNGSTLFVDARKSGIRADGVAWVGSPLLEAASAVSQIPVTAAQLMTKGGTISIDMGALTGGANLDPAAVPAINIAKGALLDISGGWVTYAAGLVQTSELITGDGRIVNIAAANPNDSFVAVVNGFTDSQAHFGISQTYRNAALQGLQFDQAYDQGRDAGALAVVGSRIAFDATLYANGFAGANQLAGAVQPTASSSIAGDPRKLQATEYQLPAGGLFRIGSFSGSSAIGLGQDIVVDHGASATAVPDPAQILLNDQMLSSAGLSGLLLQTSGAVTLRAPSQLALAPGGVLEIDAGRAIRLDGDVRIADGRIAARTYQLTSVISADIGTVGNPFRGDDDIARVYDPGAMLPNPFDITIAGTLSVAGRWVNDYSTAEAPQGAGWINGGAISLTVAPRVFVPLGTSAATAAVAGDLSGSIRIAAGALLDVSAGGFVSTQRKFNLTASGGSVSLIDQTTYATVIPVTSNSTEFAGTTQFGQSVAFTPVAATGTTIGVMPSLVPVAENSGVHFGTGSIRGFGFGGGGAFTLVSPDVAFGNPGAAFGGGRDDNATAIPLDFLQRTGFGTLDVTSYHARIVPNLFDAGSSGAISGLSAFFDTTALVVGAGQQLNLSQALLPNVLDDATQNQLLTLASGADVAALLTPAVPSLMWFQKAATLDLRGLMELDVAAGGSIIGAPQAAIITPKLDNAGTITLHGGTIQQVATLPAVLNGTGIGLIDVAQGGSGFGAVFGTANAQGQYAGNGLNSAGLTNPDGSVQTNNQIFTTPGSEHFFYFLGQVGAQDGIVLATGSRTDLSGVALYNPTAAHRADGTLYRFGTLLGGGSISAAAALNPTSGTAQALFANPAYGFAAYPDPTNTSPTPPPLLAQTAPRQFIAQPGAAIDISGTSAIYDEPTSATDTTPSRQWSDAGTIALHAGGTLSGAVINAQGGAAPATGGTLIWLDPTLRAADENAGAANVAFADQITRAGFSTLIAEGGLTLDGQFALSLDKALLVRSAPSLDATPIGSNAAVVISAEPGTVATIAAPYINFSSRAGVSQSSGNATGNAEVTFAAGGSGMDMIGGILFDASIAQTTLASVGDVRLIGVDDRASSSQRAVLDGNLTSAGNLTFDAGRVYTTTGTGNLQRLLEDAAGATDANKPSPYILQALGASTITFLGDHIDNSVPLSAGSYLRILADTVVQNGYLAAPLGEIEFGTSANPGSSINFGAGSVAVVSAVGQKIPYGTTTDLTQYFFTPGTSSPLTQLPSGSLRMTAGHIGVEAGGKIVGTGGGDVFAFEFVSGTGGSRDLLSRFNSDEFSANHYNAATGLGYQYADSRQVYAIVPAALATKVALYDPVYAADYNGGPIADDNGVTGPTNLYGTSAGLAVTLDGGGGIAAGQYVLMPAHYALLPGAYRVVANSGVLAPAPGVVQTLRDGSIVMGGAYATAGTGLVQSARVSFTIESPASFLKYSNIQTTSGTATVAAAASSAGVAVPRVPLDAARVILDPLISLRVAGSFETTPGSGGRGSEVDILGSAITLDRTGTTAGSGLALSNPTLANLHANSLMIGGERTENANDSTQLGITAKTIAVDASASIAVPELILAVAGAGSTINVRSGARLTATGTLDDTRAGDYLIAAPGAGSVLRLSNGPQRLVDRVGAISKANSELHIGDVTLTGGSLLLDTSHNFSVAAGAKLVVPDIAIVASDIAFGAAGTIDAALEQQLAAATNLTLASAAAVTFDGNTAHGFRNLAIDAPGIALTRLSDQPQSLAITAGALRLDNSSGGVTATCSAGGSAGCGTSGNGLTIAAASLTLGSGSLYAYNFDSGVRLAALGGVYVEGAGSLNLGHAPLTLETPFVIDRAAVVDPNRASPTPNDRITSAGNYTIPITPNYVFATSGAVSLVAPVLASGAPAPVPAGLRAPGSHIAFGSAAAPVAGFSSDGVAVTATSGVIDVEAQGAITLAKTASLATPGTSRSYGDSQSTTTVFAGGGTVNLVSLTGDIALASSSAITVDNGIGTAGTLNLLAARGSIMLAAKLNAGATGARQASLTFDSQKSAFDLNGFATTYGALFAGDLQIRSGVGDLLLGAGSALRARAVSLTADGGRIAIAGSIDTAGVSVRGLTAAQINAARIDGGAIALWGMDGVRLAAGSRLDTHTSGYADADLRQASAGKVTIGIGDIHGAIAIDTGATIDVSATRTLAAQAAGLTGNRLVAQVVKNPATLVDNTVYQFVAADTGGAVHLRAPLVGAGENQVDVRLHGKIVGASSTTVEAFKSYNLDDIANAGNYDGVTASGTGVALNAVPTGNNILSDVFVGADGTKSIPYFIQNFAVSASDGSSFAHVALQPGVDLVSAGDITLASAWNLAAGTLNTPAALAGGDLAPIPELGLRADGSPYYAVVAGHEADLLQNHVSFLYRVGHTASGAAGIFGLRAGGNLDITGSISDGFYSFADKSDPAYINYQLGGNRVYDPALLTSCGTTLDCSAVASYTSIAAGTVAANPGNTITINLSKLYPGNQEGAVNIAAPYADAANSAVASGSNFDPNTGNFSGDPLGFAQLFPLLADGTAMQSSTLRLVAGAASTVSANPLHVDRATAANVTVEGEQAYSFTATPGGLGTSLDLRLAVNGLLTGTDPVYTLNGLIGSTAAGGSAAASANVAALTPDSYTAIRWGAGTVGAPEDLRQAALMFFASRPAAFTRNGAGVATGVAAPLGEILTFLQGISSSFINGSVTHRSGYPSSAGTVPPVINFGTGAAYANTLVRTGNGAISVAAAGNVDLTNASWNLANFGVAKVYRTADNTEVNPTNVNGAQVGGTAIYTAGQRVSRAAQAANVVGSGALVSVAPASSYQTIGASDLAFLPSPKGFDGQAAVLATGGGAVAITAGGSVLAVRDAWSERFLTSGAKYSGSQVTGLPVTAIGDASQLWRPGVVGQDTEIAIAPKYFTSGVGALAGSDVAIAAGGNVSDLTVALDAAVTTAATSSGLVEMTLGHGDLVANVSGDLQAGQFDVAAGSGNIAVLGSVVGFGKQPSPTTADKTQYLRLRVANADVALTAQGSIALAGVSALGAARSGSANDKYNAAGYFAGNAGFSAVATGSLSYIDNRFEQTVPFQVGAGGTGNAGGGVLPPSLTLAALTSNLTAPSLPLLLYPSATGNLALFSAGNIASLVIAMSDSDPSLLPGAFSAAQVTISDVTATGAGKVTAPVGLGFGIPGVDPTTSDPLLRLYHDRRSLHAADTTPVAVFAGNDIALSLINVPKLAAITAGRDIVNLYFTGQNVNAADSTAISAGRDITSTTNSSTALGLPYIVSNDFVLGGPGSLLVQAGRDIGPFINSAVVANVSYAGGIQTVGNTFNPWIGSRGADLTVLFGVAGGVDYAALRDIYLNPANFTALDSALFVQTADALGNAHPVRTEQIYAPILATWLRDNAPMAFATIFNGAGYPDTTGGNAALTLAAYGQSAALYQAFIALNPSLQDKFLVQDLYFNELRQAAEPASSSYLQYVRGYRAVATLFPTSRGYTDNLAVYTTAPGTKSADHPLGVPVRNLVAGQPEKAAEIHTGNADLRLATIQTASGGALSILGPGGNFIAGSVVRTSTQAASRATRFGVDPAASLAYGQLTNANVQRISAIPIGYEGVLTLNGGAIDAFTDGNFLVNQSRVFSEAGGDITMWSSNGDLNAGQGPRSASNFPPVTVRFDLDGYSQIDSAGSVSGAGIGAFQRSPSDPTSSVVLIAPAGLVDAGDAGVRATGDVLVAAAHVANADSFSAGGKISGVPSRAGAPAAAAPTSAASAIAAQTHSAGNSDSSGQHSIITVDVLGYVGTPPPCDDPTVSDPDCKKGKL